MQKIGEFLNGKVVFLTGATGFLGQPLVEKILFVAPDVSRIHVLIRPKHQMGGRVVSAQRRLERELHESSVFDRLRSVYGDSFDHFLNQKLVAVAGDISEENLGMSNEVRKELRESVDIVINSAAVVSFDAALDEALSLNILAARRVAEFAKSCRKAVLVHVSTAYVSGATHKSAPETIYHAADPDAGPDADPFPKGQIRDLEKDLEKIRSIVNRVREEAHAPEQDRKFKLMLLRRPSPRKSSRRRDRVETLRRRWMTERFVEVGMAWARERGWNDTYTYTKAIGEHAVLSVRGDMPTVILRPSVIESSLSEPSPGWLDGLRMADPLIAAIGKGRLKSLPLNPDVLIDLVPVDVVVNTLLASLPKAAQDGGLAIYQVATGSQNPITLGELYELIYRYFVRNPMLDKSGTPIEIRRLKFPNPATFRFRHRLKTVPLDTAERTLERLSIFESTKKVKRRISAAKVAHQKLYYYGEIYEPYLNLDCQFQVDNTIELFNSLDADEKRRFNFDVTRLNWRHYIQNIHIPGVKKFILKIEGAGTMELEEDASKLPVSTIPELLIRSAQRFEARTALQIKRGAEWTRISYADLRKQAERAAKNLWRVGLEKGDRVVLFCENMPEWGVAYMGAAFRGLVVVPVDAQSWYREVWALSKFTEAKAILASEKCFERLTPESRLHNENADRPVFLLNVQNQCLPFWHPDNPKSTNPRLQPDSQQPPPVVVQTDDPTSIIFTQGSAVDPKGAVHTHRNFLLNLAGVNRYLPIQPGDSLLSVLPLYHALEFTCGLLMAIFGGATVTYANTLKPRAILETMRETGTTCMLGVPTFYALLRDDIERRILKTSKSGFKSNLMATSQQLSRSIERTFGRNIGRQLFAGVHQEFGGKIRLLVSGGSALGEELYEFFKVIGMPIYEGYGLTETAPVLTVNPQNLSRIGSAGKPLPGIELRLDHPDRDGVGEIVVRTPCLMSQYYRNLEATRRAMEEDWFHTGDLGWVDVGGFIYITGRIKDVIVTGAGKNVYPADLEATYSTIPTIKEICVIGVRAGLTEEVHAVIRPDPAAFTPGETTEATKKALLKEIQSLARELPSYQRLQQVHVWQDGLALDKDGLIDRAAVREKLLLRLSQTRSVISPMGNRASTREEILYQELSRLSGLPVEEIRADSDIYVDLGLDSLKAIELLLFAEDRFGVTVSDETAARQRLVGEMIDAFRERVPAQPAAPAAAPRKATLPSTLGYEQRPFIDRTIQTISYQGLKAIYRFYLNFELRNAVSIPQGQAYIIAANHSSHLDTGAVITALHHARGLEEARRLHPLGARDYFFKSPIQGWLVSRLLNVVPIERKETSLASLRLVKSILSRGEPVLIFPEGTRTRNGRLQDFKPGLGLIAWELKVPIIPVYIEGTFGAMPVGAALPRPGTVRVTFGAPVTMDSYAKNGDRSPKDEIYRRIATDVRAVIQLLADAAEAEE